MVDGINSNNFQLPSIKSGGLDEKLENAELENLLFEGEIDDADSGELIKTTDKEDVKSKYIEKYRDAYSDAKNFDVEEAHVYVEGEAEIEKMVQKELMKKSALLSIAIAGLSGKDRADIEEECRAKYAEEHPEYKAVMEEGQRVEAEHDEAKNEAMSNWEKENPKPELSTKDMIFGSVITLINHKKELAEWEKAREEQETSFDEEYTKNNPNYANLKEQEDAYAKENPAFTKILKGISISKGSVIKDL